MLYVEMRWIGSDGMGLVIIGHRYSKSTFGANNDQNLNFQGREI